MAKYKLDNKHLKEILESQGGKAVQFIKKLLIDNNKIATRNLINSLDYEVLENLNDLTLRIIASDHFKYVDQGRRPGAKPPPIKPIQSWVRTKGLVFKGLNDKQTAFIIATSIGKKGIKPLYAKDKTIKMLMGNLKTIIKGASGKDIQDLLDKVFKKK